MKQIIKGVYNSWLIGVIVVVLFMAAMLIFKVKW